MPLLLATDSLTIARGTRALAENVSRTLNDGSLLLLTGPNGSGKTSFLRSLAGLLDPASGTITRNGDHHFLAAHPIGPSLETPRQYLAFQSALIGKSFDLVADVFAVTPYLDTPLNRLSTGWRQRVKLSRLMLADKPIWLLDEPSDGLDADGEARLQNLVTTHCDTGGACVIATHDPHLWPTAEAMDFTA